jgi:membrane-bound metal-dependent hydrolase YbcI (DUF457 family)
MPFTPIHLGAGAAFKAIGDRHFSFMVFGGAQVMMDIEPLIGLIRDSDVLHGPSHTLLGALLIGTVAGLIGKPISLAVLRLFGFADARISWTASFSGALLGTGSHILLDAMMHADMRPWWPLATGNPLLGAIPTDHLHMLCLGLGVIGAAVHALRVLWRRRRAASARAP